MLRTDGERLWRSLMEMARIGATPKGGSARLALSDEDRDGRDLFVSWCREAGCEVSVDRVGNVFARRPGADPARPPVLVGSHLDTQPHGGKFDGVYGVLAGLEVIRTLDDAGARTRAPIEVAVWTNEEGARFQPGYTGSAAFAGAWEVTTALAAADAEGRSVGDELARIGYAGDAAVGGRPVAAFFEAHIEQGPILERESKTIGVVTRVQGMRWYEVTVGGRDCHAGTTPMEARRDALVGAAAMILEVDALARAEGPDARITVGRVSVEPNSPNTVSGETVFSVDLRNPDRDVLERQEAALRRAFEGVAAARGLEVAMTRVLDTPPVEFDRACVAAVREAAERLGHPHMDMVSGAGHDACYLARVAPTAMVFVPCAEGLSHNEEESAEPDDLAAGADVLLHAVMARAGEA